MTNTRGHIKDFNKSSHRSVKTTAKQTRSHIKRAPHVGDDFSSEPTTCTKGNFEDSKEKVERDRIRKARNQRKYYETHKLQEREKARSRAAKSRQMARGLFIPTYDDDDGASATHLPVMILDRKNLDDSSSESRPPDATLDALTSTTQSFASPTNLFTDSQSFSHTYLTTAYPISNSAYLDGLPNVARRNARDIIAQSHQTVLGLEWDCKPMDYWPRVFVEELAKLQQSGFEGAPKWIDKLAERICLGQRVLNDLECVVEGELPNDVDELRDIWRQTNRLVGMISSVVRALQLGMDIAVAQYCTFQGTL